MTRIAICLAALLSLLIGAPALADEKTTFVLEKLKGRQGKLLHQAAYGKDGRLGFLNDMDGDDSVEMIFTSGKKIICWNPRSNEVLWTVGLGTFVGGANPVALYDRFVDIDDDGWLDVPAASGAGDGKRELFWYKAWWEIRKR